MFRHRVLPFVLFVAAVVSALPMSAQMKGHWPGYVQPPGCGRTVWVDMVALDQPFLVNRLGASMPEGMMYALRRDVVPKSGTGPLVHGAVMLRPGKRPRPIVLRANVGDCLAITFCNLLAKFPTSTQPATRYASVHIAGMEVADTIDDDGSYVASNDNSTIPPGQIRHYLLRATEEGTYILNSEGAAFGGNNQPNDGAQVTAGLFGMVNVEPKKAEWYRSQVTHEELESAISGFSPIGQPLINYSATFTSGPNTGLPVLNMLDKDNNLIYTDLTAVITGPRHGKFVNTVPSDPSLDKVNIEPNRLDPFREFTIGYHELMDAVQAYPIFGQKTPDLATTLGSSGDAFAINYGTGGIGAEILANRFGLGPMNSCADCRFEEFFLSSWAVGDASMLVDVPSNAPCSNAPYNSLPYNPQVNSGSAPSAPCTGGVTGNAPSGITPIRKATMALYPDDPSNVYHSYINDRVIFRVLHTGTGVSHVHHLHAHQWLHSPNSDGSTYLDSQLINPGSHYTEEITFNGSGNRNKVVGDSIFHCHFYPHFAAGMWAMWRSHDVYEVGSPFLQSTFRQLAKYATRALPDGEIAAGTPIPAIVPMPTLMMPLMPAKVSIQAVADPNGGPNPAGYEAVVDPSDIKINPGFPFFIPGVGGTRAPHPPLDFAVENNIVQDGGLPRHLLLNAAVTTELHTTTDFTKNIDHVNAYELPEDGTPVEKTAMKFHSTCFHPSFRPDGTGSTPSDPGFRTNGRKPVSGAPYADPGLNPWDPNNPPPPSQQCNGINNWTEYKAAVIQTDLVINKQGWHYPQSRLLTLWSDVLPTIRSQVPQEPFFIRANAGTGVVYWHTNLVPSYYEVDDYQVRTPTDIIGQHIHLVKFDVTSSDGAANGYNYEDGTLSYQEVQELVHGVNQCGGLGLSTPLSQCGTAANRQPLTLKPPPATICPAGEMAQAPCNGWMGAQTTVQRWFADPIEDRSPSNNALKNGTRTLRTVFTHDHFGPSTHQQVGLYAALLIEPARSTWFQSESGTQLHTRDDGGPTTWNAVIESPRSEANTYREFALAMQDFQFAYKSTSKNTLGGGGFPGWADPPNVIEAPFGSGNNNLQPQIISAGPTSGTTSFNYRNEPLPFRVQSGSSSDPHAADLSYVYNSNVTRNNAATNSQPTLGAPIAAGSVFAYPQKPLTEGMEGGDPYTPLLRAYEGDRVQVRVIAGAHMLPHAFTVGGMKWLFEPSFSDSGYRSTQSMGISEHFEMLFRTPRASPSADGTHNFTDYLYMPDASNQKHGIIDGTWGIFRAYKSTADTKTTLLPLTTNKTVKPLPPPADTDAGYSCPPSAPKKSFTIVARTPGTVIFNSRGTGPAGLFSSGTQITNFYPMVFTVGASNDTGQPAVVRANAGDCIALTVQNAFNPSSQTFNQTSTAAFATNIPLAPSKYAGATPSLLAFDAMKSTGLNVGFNPDQIIPVGSQKTYYWYAGETSIAQNGKITGTALELGGVNITPSDPLEQDLHGLVAGLVVEPKGAIACLDTYNPALNLPQYGAATVYSGGTCASPGRLLYREFVLITQDDLSDVEWYGGLTTIGATQFKAPGGTTQLGVNYRIEPMPYRFAAQASSFNANPNLWMGFSNGLVLTDPLTPILSAALSTPTRIHLLHPAGSGNQQVMALHGHVWEELPFRASSAALGHNRLSQHLGARDSHGTNTSYPIIIPSAGGSHPTTGDYLWRTTPSNYLQQGLWGIFRVSESGVDSVKVTSAQFTSGGNLSVYGTTGVFLDKASNPKNGERAPTVSLFLGHNGQLGDLLSSTVPVGENGLWNFPTKNTDVNDDNWQITAKSPNGGVSVAPVIIVAAPATPQGAPITTPKQPVGESNRFVGQQRSHNEQNAPTGENEGPAQLIAPAPPPAAPPAKPPSN